ncbi:hypothetical protein HY442_01520 [Candidatus Parcubacteria bacterium]|nr:hypothetical protein [Candidatus Parcubacteria bacterium]MBI4099191.1 hypothetical protein [Candidatus Parcubacteria bacterium]
MAQISRFRLSARVQEELVDTFLESLIRIDNKHFARCVLNDLFTPTEKIMIGKRILVAILLLQGYSYSDIIRSVKVAPATINGIKTTLSKSGEGFRALFLVLQGTLADRAARYRREERQEIMADRIGRLLSVLRLPVKGSKSDMARWRRALGA